MKKIFFIISLLAVFFMSAPMIFAGESDQNGVKITVADAETGDFTYSASPNVTVLVLTDNTSYAIYTTNLVTNTTNGMDYFTISTATGYAQRTKQETQPSALDSTTTAPSGGTWIWMGGSGS